MLPKRIQTTIQHSITSLVTDISSSLNNHQPTTFVVILLTHRPCDGRLCNHPAPLLLDQIRYVPPVCILLFQQLLHLTLEHIAWGERVAVLALATVGALPEPVVIRTQQVLKDIH